MTLSNLLKWAGVLLLTVGLSGCATNSAEALVDKTKPMMGEGEGLVVASVGACDSGDELMTRFAKGSSFVILAERQGGTDKSPIIITTNGVWQNTAWSATELLRTTGTCTRLLLSQKAPAGNYKVTQAAARILNLAPRSPILADPIYFNVRAGQVVYIGAYDVSYIAGTTPIFHVKTAGMESLRILDEFRQDRETLIRVRPELAEATMVNAIETQLLYRGLLNNP